MNKLPAQFGIDKNKELADFWGANACEERRNAYFSFGVGAVAMVATVVMIIQNNAEATAAAGAITSAALLHGKSQLQEVSELRDRSHSFLLTPEQQPEGHTESGKPVLRLIVNENYHKSS